MPHAYLSKATEARSAVVAGQTEGRMSDQAHAAPLLYVRPHPTAARRAATLASSECEMRKGARTSLRPLQRRFKARKKPEGYTSTPTGLKRLKTQNTAFRGNENGKGTPSGVPQPIHKRKLILVKEEFDASSFGGAAENRTRVWPAVNHRLPSRAYPTLDAHPRTGAFGEPARLVDDVHVLAGRIHRPTVRPVRSLVVRPRPFDRQMAESGLTRRA